MGIPLPFLLINISFYDHIEISSTSIRIEVLHNTTQNTFHRRSCNHD